MEIKKLFLIFFVILNTSLIFSAQLNDVDYLKLEIENIIEFGIDFESESKVSELNVTSYFFTQNFKQSQYLNSFETNMQDYILQNDSGILNIRHIYDDTTLKSSNRIVNTFTIESTTHKPKIRSKQIYPIAQEDLNSINQSYLSFYEFIDTNDAIKSQASKLAQGEDDVYIIASKIAKWIIEDVEYDLETIFENPNQASSEVFQSKQGVCREISNLFISMLRSIGIPARVAIGYAYTESEDLVEYVGSNWGGHAWTEVLIGDEWVPFDLTYNQYGFVDATHIATDKYQTIRPRSVTIAGRGYGFSIAKDSLISSPSFKILSTNDVLYDPGFNIEISGPDEIGFGSYGYLRLDIENEEDYYQLLFLKFAMPPEIELLDQKEKMYVFTPNEKKEIYFRFKLPETLDPNKIYTFPFTVYNDFLKETYNIESRESYLSIKEIALPEEIETQTTLSDNEISANCNFILDSPKNLVICSFRNPNNFEANNVQVCFDGECKRIDIKVGSFESISFETSKTQGSMSYSSEYGSNIFEVKAILPEFETELTKDNETFSISLETSIENTVDGLSLNYYLNDNFTTVLSAKELNIQEFNLNPGTYNIRIDLTFNNETIDTYTSEIFFNERTLWERFKLWFLDLITF